MAAAATAAAALGEVAHRAAVTVVVQTETAAMVVGAMVEAAMVEAAQALEIPAEGALPEAETVEAASVA
eukprot:3000894-Pleurochrysis_carterae.AAC.1